MVAFLSPAWVTEMNATLAHAGAVPFERGTHVFRVVLNFVGAPPTLLQAVTFTLSGAGATVEPGDHATADALVSLDYADALALHAGEFSSATAMREGRVKVRGDINAIVPVLAWLQQAHPTAH